MTSNMRIIIKNSSLLQLFSSRIAIQICTILQSIIIARILGPEGKGYFTEITIYPTIIASIAMLGLYTGIVKLSAKKNIREKFNVTKSIIICCSIMGVIGSIIAFLVNKALFKTYIDFKIAAYVFSIYVLIYTLNRGLSAFNNGSRNLKLFSISSVILYPSYFLLITILFFLHKVSIPTCIYSLLVANLASLLFLFYKNEEKFDKKKPYKPIKLFKYSLKFSIADFSEPIYLYFDKALLAFYLSAYDLGLYTIAVSSAGLINIFSNTFSIKLFSDIANRDNKNVCQYIKINFLLMIFSAFILSFVFPIIIPFLYGSQYQPSVMPSIIALIICIFRGQSLILERSILATGRPFVGVTAKIIGIITFALLLLILHFAGFANVITATMAALITATIYYAYIAKQGKIIFHVKESFFPKFTDVKIITQRIIFFLCR